MMTRDQIQTVLNALQNSQLFVQASSNINVLEGFGQQLDDADEAIALLRAFLAEPSEPIGYAYENQDFIGSVIGAKGDWAPHEIPLFTHPASKPLEPDKDLTQALTERDEYHDMADKLAEGIALHFDGDIGEHSSSNSPWDRALDLLDSAACAETMRLTHPASKPSEPKPYCCYCESDNEGIRSTYFDQTCEGCVKRMTRPAKPEKLTEREIWQTYAAGFSAEKAEPFEQIKNDPEWAEIVYMTRCIEAAVWAKFAAVKQDEAIKEKFE